MTFEPAADQPEQVLRLDRPFAIVSCEPEGGAHLSKGPNRQRVVYLHGTTRGVFAVTLAASRSGKQGPRGNWVNATDELRIGGARLRTWMEEVGVAKFDEADRHNLLSPLSSPAEVPRLEIMPAGSNGRRVVRRLRRPLTVLGRGPQSRIRIDDPSVSSVHCVLYQEAGRLWVIDLLSETGTSLNGKPVRVAEVSPGDLLELGEVRIRWLGTLTDKPNDPSDSLVSDRVDQSSVEENAREELLGTERSDEGDSENSVRSPSISAASRDEMFGTFQRQLAEFQASLEAISRESAQRDQSLQEIQETLRGQRESEDRVLEALERTEGRWRERLDHLQAEMASARAESDRRFEEAKHRFEIEEGHLRDLRQELTALLVTNQQQAETKSASAQQIEASRADFSKAVRAIEGLEEKSQQLTQSYALADQRIREESRRRKATEKVQETLETWLQELRQQATDMHDSLGRLRSEFDAGRVRQDDVLSALRTAVDSVQEKLTILSVRTADHNRLLQRTRSEQQEIAQSLARNNQDLLARVEVLEASYSERLESQTVGGFAEDSTIGATGSAPEASTSIVNTGRDIGQTVLEQPSGREPYREEPAYLPAQGNVAIGTDVEYETTDRILDRQLDLDAVTGGHWRKRLRWLIAAMLGR